MTKIRPEVIIKRIEEGNEMNLVTVVRRKKGGDGEMVLRARKRNTEPGEYLCPRILNTQNDREKNVYIYIYI